MKTSAADFLLSSVCITLLFLLAIVTAGVLSIDSPYRALLELGVFLLAYGCYTALLLAVLRRLRPYPLGRFSMESREFTYWKLIAVLTDLAEKALRPFVTVFTQPLIWAAFGADVGKNAAIAGIIRDLPLVQLGAYCTIGQNSVITAHAITHDEIILKPVRIGANAVVGVNCVVMPGVTLGENAVLAAGAVATIGTQIPANELWGGIPARKIKNIDLNSADPD
ncbi:MAG: DapH/DapD/GlmU-related protein [Candidatus Nanopelagicaceae bacterium]|nr:DapH/DapD/GlmU-related protein [Candidatus Nanopelagicaceae bacterium]